MENILKYCEFEIEMTKPYFSYLTLIPEIKNFFIIFDL